MARAVLRRALRVTHPVAVILLASTWNGAVALAAEGGCDLPAGVAPAVAQAWPELTRAAERSAFFRWAVKRFGAPSACQATVNDGAVVLSYTFARAVRFTATASPASESSVQRLELPDRAGIEAKTLLRHQEKASVGQDGCGIEWSKPQQSAGAVGAVTSFVGDVCNCQARIERSGTRIRVLEFRSAC
jgi:hypothetical protein